MTIFNITLNQIKGHKVGIFLKLAKFKIDVYCFLSKFLNV